MAIVKKAQEVNYSCAQMYALVNEVERYAEFLPYCKESIVHHRDADEVQATLMVSAMGVQKSFTTKNRLQQDKMIEIRLVNGPFSHLEGFWRFDPTEKGCLISFDLEFEWAGKMFSMILGPVFEEVTNQMVDAFCKRATEIYHDQSDVVV